MTRTVLLGDVDPDLEQMYVAVSTAQRAVVAAVRPGVVAGSLDQLARDSLSEFGDFILHATGHGVGLDIHEAPWLRNGSTDELQVHHVVTVEPGLYRVGVGGVRIEDLLLVEPTGSRTLTTSPKEPSCPQSAPTT
jgi:Xaa-Pro aminopeptidase